MFYSNKFNMKLFLAVLLATGVLAGVQSREVNWRIVGGSVAQEGAYPYQISLKRFGAHRCGGAIIDESTVITAAHCLQGISNNGLTIVAGTNQVNSGGDEYAVLDTRVHSNFLTVQYGDDIAIIKVDPITFTDRVQPIELETTFLEGGVDCLVTGWGTESFGGNSPIDLLEVHLKTVTTEVCKNDLSSSSSDWVITDYNICTFTKFGEGVCHGDSGGPLVANNKLIGIVSGGKPCGLGFPDVYTRVSAFSDWIAENRH